MIKLVIHGGAGSLEGNPERRQSMHEALQIIVTETFAVLQKTTAKEAVLHGVRLLEDDELFNAGTGSKLQADGQVRMTAALMLGWTNQFSGVMNVQNIKNPIDVAHVLSGRLHTVLGGELATAFSHQHNFDHHDPIIPYRLSEYQKKLSGQTGTVGVVALDTQGHIVVGTSTGGAGYETPGRVSDSATVAGTYASEDAGVSCTGIGEDIVNQAVAAKVITRVQDGMSLEDAVSKTIEEGNHFKYRYGFISLDRTGNIRIGKTDHIDDVFYAFHDGETIKTFF